MRPCAAARGGQIAGSDFERVAPRRGSKYPESVQTSEFDYELPPERIAQEPANPRDHSRLMVLHREEGRIGHRRFYELPELLRPGDALILNDSRVIPAKLRARRLPDDKPAEILLLEPAAEQDWWVLAKPARRLKPGARARFVPRRLPAPPLEATVLDRNEEGHRLIRFDAEEDPLRLLSFYGETPLPPYIRRPSGETPADPVRYQTVYAKAPGSVAAPTAGLHFTEPLLERLRAAGVETATVTLHVGLGTFAPVKTDRVEEHPMHAESFELPASVCDAVRRARRAGGRVIAVGTTSVRALETAAQEQGNELRPVRGRTRLFIRPPWEFRATDAMITNFHLPRSTLLMLTAAFAAPGSTRGRELILRAYREAIDRGYRFYSYGDAMLIL